MHMQQGFSLQTCAKAPLCYAVLLCGPPFTQVVWWPLWGVRC